jgi:hypothetical protein
VLPTGIARPERQRLNSLIGIENVRQCDQDPDGMDHDMDLSRELFDRQRALEQCLVNFVVSHRPLNGRQLLAGERFLDRADAGC